MMFMKKISLRGVLMKLRFFIMLTVLIALILCAYLIKKENVPDNNSILVKEVITYEYDK